MILAAIGALASLAVHSDGAVTVALVIIIGTVAPPLLVFAASKLLDVVVQLDHGSTRER